MNLGFKRKKDKPTKEEVNEGIQVAHDTNAEVNEFGEEVAYPDEKLLKGVTGILNDIVLGALNKNASDIHMEPTDENLLVRYRIDGILRDIYTIDKQYEQSLIFKIKVNSKLRTDEHFAPQDGRIPFQFEEDKLDTRISIIPTTRGEKVVIRLLTQKGRSFDLKGLGLRDKDLEIVEKAYKKPYGTIISAGPTGSGKTTTLYSILKIINSREKNITTIEDPVEYDLLGVNHIQINVKAGLTFENGLRSILRQDPNVIMIGEIRDSETAKIATNAAMTGHLVLTTIHTNDAITTIPRLIDMGIDPYLVATTLNVVIAQRLARRLCEKCRKQRVITKEEYSDLQKYRADLANLIKPSQKIFHEEGCKECGDSGFKGRVGLYEVLEVTEEIRDIIMGNSANTDDIFKVARKQGLITIVEDGVNKLNEGMTSLSELMRVTALKE